MSSQFVTLGELGDVLGVSRSTAARMTEQDGFPEPVNVGGRRAWLRTEVEQWAKANPPRPPGRPPKREGAQPALTISLRDVVTEISDESADLLIAELEKLGRTGIDFDAAGAAATVAEYRDHDEPAHPPRGELSSILRALDHLRWLGAPTDIILLGRGLVGHLNWTPIWYELQLPERRRLESFVSHSGPYIAGDRLITPEGEEWHIARAETEREPTRLVCDPWSAEPSQDRGLP